MDKPKTPETLESETPFEASGTNQNGSGLASVSDVLVAKNVEVETLEAVENERLVEVTEVEDSARFEGENSGANVTEIEEGCFVSDDCVDVRESVAKLDSSGLVENEAELRFLESKSVENECEFGLVESKLVENEVELCLSESKPVENEAELGLLDSKLVENEVELKSKPVENEAELGLLESKNVAELESKPVENEAELGLLESKFVEDEAELASKPVENEAELGLLDSKLVVNEAKLESKPVENEAALGLLESKNEAELEPKPVENEAELGLLESKFVENEAELELKPVENEAELGLLGSKLVENEAELGLLESKPAENEADLGLLELKLVENEADLGLLESKPIENEAELGLLELKLVENEADLGLLESKPVENEAELESKLVENEGELGLLELKPVEDEAEFGLGLLESKLVENDAELGFLESKLIENEAELGSLELKSVENEAELGLLESKSDENEAELGLLKSKLVENEAELELKSVENEADLGLLESKLVENEADLGLLESKSLENEDAEVEEMGEENSLELNGIAVSEGISLYVDISGSPSGFAKHEDSGEEQKRSVDGREFSFLVGDIVWVQTKNQSWWPGKICDPVCSPKNAGKSGKGADLLVWYYCVSQFVWCFPFQLRPFHESFKEMSGKNRAKLFLVAVDKALEEFGRCVKSEMICLCDSKHKNQQSAGEASTDGGVRNSKSTFGRLGGFSVTNFEPLPLVEHLKYLAQVVSMPCKLDFSVTQNRLSAFYSSIGHRQLPINLLAEKDESEEETLSQPRDQVKGDSAVQGNSRKNGSKECLVSSGSRKRKMKKVSEIEVEDTGDEVIASFCLKDKVMKKGSDLRERKKSRYLSYPYINFGQKGAAKEDDAKGPKVASEASDGVGQDIVSPVNSKNNSEKFWKKWYKNFSGEIQIPDGSELRIAASAKWLRELRSVAVDGLHPKQNSGFTSVGWFFSRFRISAYHDESIDETCPKNMSSQNVANDSEPILTGESKMENKPKKKGKKKNENSMEHLQGKISPSSPNVVSSDVPTLGEDLKGKLDPSSGKDSLTAVKKPGQTDSERLKTKPLSRLSDVNISVTGLGVSVKDALETCRPLPCTSKAKKKKKKKHDGSILEHPQTEKTTDIPDLNRSNSVPSVNDSQVVNHVALEGIPDGPMDPDASAVDVSPGLSDACGTDAKPGNLVVDLGVPLVGLASLNYVSHTAVLLDFVGNNVKPGLIEKDEQPFGVFAVEEGNKSMPKKRKRKEKKVATEQHIPDLNGASGEPNSVAKETQETNGATPPVKPTKKKKKKMQFVLNYPRNPSFDNGTALILTFDSETEMPSREDLISTFGKFGQLKESETTVSGETKIAQIAFVKSADASKAFKSMERKCPFGSTLVNFQLHQLSAPPKVPETSHAQPPSAAPPLDFIKQNLQMMTSMLEKSGDNLSQEMRIKLESEIKGLLGKVSSMAGSCS